MAKKWIQKAIKRPGALIGKAKKAGKSVVAFAAGYKGNSTRTKKQIALRNTLVRLRGGK